MTPRSSVVQNNDPLAIARCIIMTPSGCNTSSSLSNSTCTFGDSCNDCRSNRCTPVYFITSFSKQTHTHTHTHTQRAAGGGGGGGAVVFKGEKATIPPVKVTSNLPPRLYRGKPRSRNAAAGVASNTAHHDRYVQRYIKVLGDGCTL